MTITLEHVLPQKEGVAGLMKLMQDDDFLVGRLPPSCFHRDKNVTGITFVNTEMYR
jgi:hypothetical protein